jgi:cell wall-associated NlpC family hydrolase
LESDGYVGWLSSNALSPPGPTATHRITALRTLAFPGPDIKLPPLLGLPLGARVAVVKADERFAVTASGLHLPAMHLSALDAVEPDYVTVAERFLGAPYLWGGKTSFGIDCSGLVQVALAAANVPCPRDSDLQEQALGSRLAISDLRRGDMIFWKGHVAIARDGDTLVHANAHHMAVATEPVAEAVARIKTTGGDVTSVRRLDVRR